MTHSNSNITHYEHLKEEFTHSWLIEGIHITYEELYDIIQIYNKSINVFKHSEPQKLYQATEYLHGELFPDMQGGGKFRQVDVTVGGQSCPPHQKVPSLILEWCNEIYKSDNTNSLVGGGRLGELHAHFEHIHPFIDGNGRIGRMLVPLLCHRFDTREMLYPSKALYQARPDYYSSLSAWRYNNRFVVQELFRNIDTVPRR